MIAQSTVFIIGAGGSKPYGYPTGHELRQEILAGNWKKWADNEVSANEFIQHYNLSSNESIDLFLSRNCKYAKLGKMAVAYCIMEAEKRSRFRSDVHGGTEEDWYSYLFNKMVEGIVSEKDIDDFEKNKCTFITFNYDRSFEHFMFESLQHSFVDVSEERVKRIWSSQPVFHVYGQVAQLPWESPEHGVAYREGDNRPVAPFIDGIFLINEERGAIDTIRKQDLIRNAEKVFFLGFGYHPENLELLGFPGVYVGEKKIYGSAIGFCKEELDKISLSITRRNPPVSGKRYQIHPESSCKEVLRKYL